MIIVGVVIYDIIMHNPDESLDYVNLIEAKDGNTTTQFKAIEPFKIRDVVALDKDRALITADYAGIVLWNTKDKFVYNWKFTIPPPRHICPREDSKALVIGKDGFTMISIDTRTGSAIAYADAPAEVIGKPILFGSDYIVPVNGGLLVLDDELNQKSRLFIPEVAGSASLAISGGAIVVASDKIVIRIAMDPR